MAGKFKLVEEPYTRTVLKKDGDQVVAENKEVDIKESIKALDINIGYTFQYIPLEKIEPNPKNKVYRDLTTEEDIRMLADSIAAYGMGTNLLVRKSENPDMYTLISGESRTRALELLKSEDIDVFPSGVPASIVMGDLTPEDEDILIHMYNIISRKYQPEKYIQLVADFEKRLTESAKKKGKKVKNINRLISNITGISERMAKRIRSYNANLIPELLDALGENKIGQRDADVYTRLSAEDQKLVSKYVDQGKALSLDELSAIKDAAMESQKAETNIINVAPDVSDKVIMTETKNKPGSSTDDNEGEREQNKEAIRIAKPTLDNPVVRKKVLERELDKLTKNLKRMITDFISKEDEYRSNYDGDSDKYGTLVEALKNAVSEGK